VGERPPVGHVEGQACDVRECRPGDVGRGDHLGAGVSGDDLELPATTSGLCEERDGDIRAARPDVEDRRRPLVHVGWRRGQQPIYGQAADPDAAKDTVYPPQVAQVAGQCGRIVERPVEELLGVG
jgi:hypothetical protein